MKKSAQIALILYVIFTALFLAACICIYRDAPANLKDVTVFFELFMGGIYTTLFYAFYQAANIGLETQRILNNFLTQHDYDELQNKYGSVLAQTSALLEIERVTCWRWRQYPYNVVVRICQGALFITYKGPKSFCVPYAQYTFCGKEDSFGRKLIVENIIPKEIFKRFFPKEFFTKDHLTIALVNIPKKQFNLILSLVQQTHEKAIAKNDSTAP